MTRRCGNGGSGIRVRKMGSDPNYERKSSRARIMKNRARLEFVYHRDIEGVPMTNHSLIRDKSVRELVSRDEWEKRVDLAACYRLIDLYAMSEMSANHVTTRVPGQDDTFLINPHGLLYDQMSASCFIKMRYDGEVLFNPTDYGINKAGYVIHSAIHTARHDVDCVIHTHTIAGMAVSAMKCGLLPIAQTSMRFAKIAYHDYEGVVLDLGEQQRLLRDLGDYEGMILRNHGVIVVGASIAEAFNSVFRLERACQVQIAALSCNVEIQM